MAEVFDSQYYEVVARQSAAERLLIAARDRIFRGNGVTGAIRFDGRGVDLLAGIERAQFKIGQRGRSSIAKEFGVKVTRVAQVMFGSDDAALLFVDFAH